MVGRPEEDVAGHKQSKEERKKKKKSLLIQSIDQAKNPG